MGQGATAPAAFVLAWRLSKATAQISVAGTSYGNRQQILAELSDADPSSVRVELRRERDNLIDRNAVVVSEPGGNAFLPA